MKASLDQRTGRFGVLELKLLQGAAIFLTIAIVKLVPEILSVDVWWFLAAAAACAIRPIYVFLRLDRP